MKNPNPNQSNPACTAVDQVVLSDFISSGLPVRLPRAASAFLCALLTLFLPTAIISDCCAPGKPTSHKAFCVATATVNREPLCHCGGHNCITLHAKQGL